MSQWQLRQLKDSWHGGDGGEVNTATSEGGSRPCHQSCHLAVTFSLQLYNSPIYYTVHIHAALGDGGPRSKTLNVAVATSYWRNTCRRGYPGRGNVNSSR